MRKQRTVFELMRNFGISVKHFLHIFQFVRSCESQVSACANRIAQHAHIHDGTSASVRCPLCVQSHFFHTTYYQMSSARCFRFYWHNVKFGCHLKIHMRVHWKWSKTPSESNGNENILISHCALVSAVVAIIAPIKHFHQARFVCHLKQKKKTKHLHVLRQSLVRPVLDEAYP